MEAKVTLGEVEVGLEGVDWVVEGVDEVDRVEGVAARPARFGAIKLIVCVLSCSWFIVCSFRLVAFVFLSRVRLRSSTS